MSARTHLDQNVCVSQNDEVRRKENETTYLDPEALTCPAPSCLWRRSSVWPDPQRRAWLQMGITTAQGLSSLLLLAMGVNGGAAV